MNKNKGFTLIELLVVIAIIGILSSVVLASLNSARAKGADAAIKSNLNNIRAQAELYYDNHGNTYTDSSANDPEDDVCTSVVDGISKGFNAAKSQAASDGGSDCNATGTAWAAAVELKTSSSDNAYWCVDSTGNSKVINTMIGETDVSCD